MHSRKKAILTLGILSMLLGGCTTVPTRSAVLIDRTDRTDQTDQTDQTDRTDSKIVELWGFRRWLGR